MTCRRGPRCSAKDPQGNPAPADRALCVRDEDELGRAIRDFPRLLTDLRVAMLAALPGRGMSEPTAGGAVEAPLPFRADLDDLANNLVVTTVHWAGIVAAVAGADRPPPGAHLAGRALERAVKLLRGHLSVFLALQPVTVVRDGANVALDGGDAALELFQLHHRVRAVLGTTRKVVYLTNPCPSPGCGVKALCRFDDQDGLRCAACGAEHELDDIQGAQVHDPNTHTTVIALGDNQYTRETEYRTTEGRRVIREQFTGHPESEAASLIGRTETFYPNQETTT